MPKGRGRPSRTMKKTLALIVVVLLTLEGASPSRAASSAPEGSRLQASREHGRSRFALLASAFVLFSAAAVLEIESDREYSRYLETAIHADMRSHYDDSECYRNLSTIALLGAEVCVVGFVVLSTKEPAPKDVNMQKVRISFLVGPQTAQVRIRW
ncbi:MAG: hypothetical protein V2A71_08225 [Candidatus Eisenbacteria bacterium]